MPADEELAGATDVAMDEGGEPLAAGGAISATSPPVPTDLAEGDEPSDEARASVRAAVRASLRAAAASSRVSGRYRDDAVYEEEDAEAVRRPRKPPTSTSAPKEVAPLVDPLAAATAQRGGAAPLSMACALCGGTDDGGVCERLMFVEPNCWVHLNCAYWSSETKEAAEATITGVGGAIKRGRRVECTHCGKAGATLLCNMHRCKRTYHFGCAASADTVLLADKRLYCPEHRTTKQATKGAVWDPATRIARQLLVQPPKRHADQGATLRHVPRAHWIRGGALTILRCGEAPSTPGAPPPGFVAHRVHWSNVRPGETCGYLLSVIAEPVDDAARAGDAPGAAAAAEAEAHAIGHAAVATPSSAISGAGAAAMTPASSLEGALADGRADGMVDRERPRPPRRVLLEIRSEHTPDAPIVSADAAEALRLLYGQLYKAQPSAAAVKARFPYVPGCFFGWLHPPVQARLHSGSSDADAADALPTNPSGCARTEPWSGWYQGAPQPATGRSGGSSGANTADGRKLPAKRGRDDPTGAATGTSSLTAGGGVEKQPGNVEKVRALNVLARTKFKVARSSIHGWGLFVKEPIAKGEMLIEYQGALIRSSLNESILRKYTRNRVFGATDGSYIFRIDEDFHVDATMAGNIARFMNHSCAPNAVSRIVEIGSQIKDKRIIIFAARDLQVGEELQYDYQFALGGEKIECHCGAANCWGRMN